MAGSATVADALDGGLYSIFLFYLFCLKLFELWRATLGPRPHMFGSVDCSHGLTTVPTDSTSSRASFAREIIGCACAELVRVLVGRDNSSAVVLAVRFSLHCAISTCCRYEHPARTICANIRPAGTENRTIVPPVDNEPSTRQASTSTRILCCSKLQNCSRMVSADFNSPIWSGPRQLQINRPHQPELHLQAETQVCAVNNCDNSLRVDSYLCNCQALFVLVGMTRE